MGALDYSVQSHNGDSFLRNALVLYSLVRRSLSAFRRLRYVGERLETGLLVLPRLSCMRVWAEFGNEARLNCSRLVGGRGAIFNTKKVDLHVHEYVWTVLFTLKTLTCFFV